MEYVQDVFEWAITDGWPAVEEKLKYALQFRDVYTVTMTLVTVAALYFAKTAVQRTVSDFHKKISGTMVRLGENLINFQSEIDASIGKLSSSTESGRNALAEQVEYFKREMLVVIEDVIPNAAIAAEVADSKVTRLPVYNHWEELSQLWSLTKIELQDLVAMKVKQLPDQNTRDRIQNLDRRGYDSVISTLSAEAVINNVATIALREMNLLYNSRKNRKRPVSGEDLDAFKAWRRQWLRAADVVLLDAAE